MAVDDIDVGAKVLVRHGEVLPLDRTLPNAQAEVDELSRTGEPYLLTKVSGDEVSSGTVNRGPPLLLQVTRAARDSTHRQILALVEAAQDGAIRHTGDAAGEPGRPGARARAPCADHHPKAI